MNALRHLRVLAPLAAAAVLAGCAASPGRPRPGSEIPAPNDVVEFSVLYAQNCAGCHGAQGKGGAAIALADPVYLAIVDPAEMRRVIATGAPGTAMPAFAQSSGGMLTDKQVDVIASEIRARWSKPGILSGVNAPSYFNLLKSPGNASQGEVVFKTYCESCHGPGGRGGPKASAITDDSFLALVSDQGLRTVVIVGRPELGAPDWRGNVPGKPMSEQEITDVVRWLVAQRKPNPGQPYSASNNAKP